MKIKSLGSSHDGSGNACSISDNYVMSPAPSFSNQLNMWYFSSCSIASFKNTLLTNNS